MPPIIIRSTYYLELHLPICSCPNIKTKDDEEDCYLLRSYNLKKIDDQYLAKFKQLWDDRSSNSGFRELMREWDEYWVRERDRFDRHYPNARKKPRGRNHKANRPQADAVEYCIEQR